MSQEENKDVELKSARELAEERARQIAEQAQSAGPGAAEAKKPAVFSPEQLEEWKRKAAERDELHERMLRALADYRNLSRRLEEERIRFREDAAAQILAALLPSFDDLERALAGLDPAAAGSAWAKGFSLVRDNLRKALAQLGVERIEEPGRPFDPALHEVAGQEPSADRPAGTVMRVVEGGYRRGDRVLRPARVVVSVAPPSTGPTDRAGLKEGRKDEGRKETA